MGRRPLGYALIGLILFLPSLAAGQAYPFRRGPCPGGETVIGAMREYRVKKEDTLLDIARRFDLGFNEVKLLYPEVDPWLPPEGMVMDIPTMWVLPEVGEEDMVVNVPELRLYFFLHRLGLVMTFPVGIGQEDAQTPQGVFRVVEKKVDPVWFIPPSLRDEYPGIRSIPPGPDNPLGKYWIGLSGGSYGIHGTNSPWGIGRLVSHGCIRLYPEDIERLFPLVRVGMKVKLTYEPVKFGCKGERILVEVHPDIYGKIPNLRDHALALARRKGILSKISLPLLLRALEEGKGIPVEVTR